MTKHRVSAFKVWGPERNLMIVENNLSGGSVIRMRPDWIVLPADAMDMDEDGQEKYNNKDDYEHNGYKFRPFFEYLPAPHPSLHFVDFKLYLIFIIIYPNLQ